MVGVLGFQWGLRPTAGVGGCGTGGVFRMMGACIVAGEDRDGAHSWGALLVMFGCLAVEAVASSGAVLDAAGAWSCLVFPLILEAGVEASWRW